MNTTKISKKSFFNFKNVFYKGWVKDYLLITLGSILIAVGFDLFLIPYNITPGGVSSLGIVVNFLTQGMFPDVPFFREYNGAIPVGFFNLLINIPLFILGIKVIGRKFGPKTLYGLVVLSVVMDIIQYFLELKYENGDMLGLSNDILLASIYGGVIVGFGLGMIFKTHATSGGSDVIAMVISKLSKTISIGRGVMMIDSMIIGISVLVFQEWKLPLYSLVSLWVTAKVIDIYLEGLSIHKAVLVISKKEEEIQQKIMKGLDRGGTLFNVKGMYTKEDKTLVFTVINRREVAILKDFIKHVDPDAFIVVLDAHEAIGEGFKSIHEDN
jgi:uncharacterized membrane-anchored protein YitT (DUF2179 family)